MSSNWFEGLDEREKGFLLATLLFRSKASQECIRFLNVQDAKILHEKAVRISELGRSQRVAILVAELKRLLMTPSPSSLALVDVSWIVEALKKETAPVQKVMLAALPNKIANSVTKEIGISNSDPSKEIQFPRELLRNVYSAIRSKIVPMRIPRYSCEYNSSTLLMLSKEELRVVIDEIGLRKQRVVGQSESHPEKHELCLFELAKHLALDSEILHRQIAHRLPYLLGERLLNISSDSKFSEDEVKLSQRLFHNVVVELASKQKIDQNFITSRIVE